MAFPSHPPEGSSPEARGVRTRAMIRIDRAASFMSE